MIVPEFQFPADDEHTTIVGRNGSGKTQMGVWLLAQQNLRNKPWVMLDYKGDELVTSIDHVKEIDFGDVPDIDGLHLLRSAPHLKNETDEFLWKIWEAGHIGVYIDEGYMVPAWDGSAYEALLTQGRALQTPVITLSQRPVKINRFALSEASHIVTFHLNDRRDRAIVQELVPPDFMTWVPEDIEIDNDEGKLPPYHSRWYALKRDERYLLRPVPDAATIRSQIEGQIAPRRAPSRTWRERLSEWWG